MSVINLPTFSFKNHPLVVLLGYFLIPLILLIYQSINLHLNALTYSTYRVESYPVHMSGQVKAGRLVADSQVDVSALFPGRQTRQEPYIKIFNIRGGTFQIGKGGAHIRVAQHLGTTPNIDNRLVQYSVGKSGFMGGYHESGAVVQERPILVAFNSQGPVFAHSEGTMALAGLQLTVPQSAEVRLTSQGDIHFPGAKVRIEDVPTVHARKGLIYKTAGFHEEAVTSTIRGERVTIHSHEGQVTGVRPAIISLNPDTLLAGGLREEEAPDRFAFTPVPLQSWQNTQVVGTLGDGNVAMLASSSFLRSALFLNKVIPQKRTSTH